MSQAHLISGIVRASSGSPIAQARVYFTNGPVALPDIAALTDSNGAFALAAPVQGVYTVEVAADAFQPITIQVNVTSMETARLEITLKK